MTLCLALLEILLNRDYVLFFFGSLALLMEKNLLKGDDLYRSRAS